ncbi:MAG: DUF4258 domain-containing protein [Acidobacteria bacterium]|nr:DUF4258 domain-containing protein [Acidobacteriota bacterium]
MDDERELLKNIKTLINANRYRIRIHAVRHMIEEGFSERNIVEAINGKSKIIENYSDDLRCLIYGTCEIDAKIRLSLHVVCDYSHHEIVDIITAYVPQKPWWTTPTRRGKTL